jgi:hypothetical protein
MVLANYSNEPSRFWTGVVHTDQGPVWNQELPASTYGIYERHGLTVSADQMTVHVTDKKSFTQRLAFGIAEGKPLWHTDRVVLDPHKGNLSAPAVYGGRPLVFGDTVLHWESDRVKKRLVARRPTDGTTLWEFDLGKALIGTIRVTNRWVIYRTEMKWQFIDRTTGRFARAIDIYSDACVSEAQFVAWGRAGLVSIDLTTPSLPIKTISHPSLPARQAHTCGRYGEQYVFFTEEYGRDAKERHHELIALSESLEQVEWQIPLGPWGLNRISRPRGSQGRQAHPLRGALSDFVPFIGSEFDNDKHKLLVLDLKKQKVAWESLPMTDLLHYHTFRGTQGQHFIVYATHIVALDGQTGKVTGAIGGNYYEVRGFYPVDGRLWAFTQKWQRMNALPWMVLDGRTLKAVAQGNHGLVIAPVLDKTIQMWRIPDQFVAR